MPFKSLLIRKYTEHIINIHIIINTIWKKKENYQCTKCKHIHSASLEWDPGKTLSLNEPGDHIPYHKFLKYKLIAYY